MSDDKTPVYDPGDITTWSLDGLLKRLTDYRDKLSAEGHDTVCIAIKLEISRVIAEIDRRNKEAMAVW